MSPPPFHPRKSLGQNFLHDRGIARRIVSLADLSKEDVVVEIGPGRGALTTHLAALGGRLLIVEIDARLLPELERRFGEAPHVEIVHRDALHFDFSTHLSPIGQGAKLVANLPYSVVSPLLFHLIDHRRAFSELIVMLPAELADRIVSPPGSRAYGILSVLLQNVAEIEKCFTVPPSAFRPRPRIDSAVVRFRLLDAPRFGGEDEAAFRRVVRAAFSRRRKTLRNALSAAIPGLSPAEAARACEGVGILPSRRAETLTLAEFGRLAAILGAPL